MKSYLAVWYDNYKMHYVNISEVDLKSAKETAFKMMCDCVGDRLYDLEVYELKSTCSCEGEANPKPTSWCHEYSGRDYFTGKRIKPLKDRK